jgi:hypothetical protein
VALEIGEPCYRRAMKALHLLRPARALTLIAGGLVACLVSPGCGSSGGGTTDASAGGADGAAAGQGGAGAAGSDAGAGAGGAGASDAGGVDAGGGVAGGGVDAGGGSAGSGGAGDGGLTSCYLKPEAKLTGTWTASDLSADANLSLKSLSFTNGDGSADTVSTQRITFGVNTGLTEPCAMLAFGGSTTEKPTMGKVYPLTISSLQEGCTAGTVRRWGALGGTMTFDKVDGNMVEITIVTGKFMASATAGMGTGTFTGTVKAKTACYTQF